MDSNVVTRIARIAHETNAAYCRSINDNSQPSWEKASEWQRSSAIKGVEFLAANPEAGPRQSHESWLKEKADTGWKYGPVKDPEKKEHPCFVAYDKLPQQQRVKDDLYVAVVRSALAHEASQDAKEAPKYFGYSHLKPELQKVSRPFGELAKLLTETLPDNGQKDLAIARLLDAKDAAVRSTLP